MEAWWQGLSTLTQAFLLGALFFSVISGGQLVAMLFGVGHFHGHLDHVGGLHHVGDVHHAGGMHHVGGLHHADTASGTGHHTHVAHDHESQRSDKAGFTFVSIRSLIAFGTLFFWAGTLYLIGGTNPILAMAFSAIWGLMGMFVVSYLMYKLVNLEEIGNVDLSTALFEEGNVYIGVPQDGVGQVRVKVSGMISYVKARSKTGEPVTRGTKVRVVGIRDKNVVEIEPLENQKGD
jgi:membrane protein implicated in regulation of membrane protease activity